ncbi:probable sodium/metabolite cotransporter BASS1, chloroplastic isoform X2 [Syzygium oleosum]|uniref:probable sodium/metabolite cotransporter BASS1, chloroplastic isoform X2 n=1 Tax=Syzygium oleosum TaxID=219896 RepID=UPI0024B906E1|nr:probable sodium/metabolite cotransporter BASS1, chloroplastic isoform X2 [Syzygium oleosum]
MCHVDFPNISLAEICVSIIITFKSNCPRAEAARCRHAVAVLVSSAQSNQTGPTTMSLSFRLTPTFSPPPPSRLRFTLLSRSNLNPSSIRSPSPSKFTHLSPIRCVNGGSDHVSEIRARPRWENALSAAASLYPLYVSVGGVVACLKPSAFQWFVQGGPNSYSLSLGLIMLAMGLTLELKDLFSLFLRRPLAVTLIAQGDVPLSIVMTVCTTLGAVLLTPLLTKILAGTYVPVDAIKLSISTLQVVVAPILLGSYFQSAFPGVVKVVTPFAPLFAVLACSLLACSVFSENVVRLKSSLLGASSGRDLSMFAHVQAIVSGELGLVILSVLLLHSAGFFVGYILSAICGFKEPQRRAISIEVGMQNSSLGVVLATSHFTSPLVALPPAMSAVIMNIMGSSLGFIWRYIDPSDQTTTPQIID